MCQEAHDYLALRNVQLLPATTPVPDPQIVQLIFYFAVLFFKGCTVIKRILIVAQMNVQSLKDLTAFIEEKKFNELKAETGADPLPWGSLKLKTQLAVMAVLGAYWRTYVESQGSKAVPNLTRQLATIKLRDWMQASDVMHMVTAPPVSAAWSCVRKASKNQEKKYMKWQGTIGVDKSKQFEEQTSKIRVLKFLLDIVCGRRAG